MTTHFDPKEGRPVQYPGEDDYPQKNRNDTDVPETEKQHSNRAKSVIIVMVAIMVAVVLIWGGASWLFDAPSAS